MLKQGRMCPLPVLAQRIHTRHELRQNFNPRIGRNHRGSIISITGKSSRIVCINGNPPGGVVMEHSVGVCRSGFVLGPHPVLDWNYCSKKRNIPTKLSHTIANPNGSVKSRRNIRPQRLKIHALWRSTHRCSL